ncbi:MULTISPECIES: hypothetical protein [unclassified Microcoleus]|uniref:hypothetical protein n=1 Tax=unclassified Microcoleus TaxID=2642155 RepID=UPI0025DCDBA8|nr:MULTISPECIES: hypothetical protein [unclassified Microcoleus]
MAFIQCSGSSLFYNLRHKQAIKYFNIIAIELTPRSHNSIATSSSILSKVLFVG